MFQICTVELWYTGVFFNVTLVSNDNSRYVKVALEEVCVSGVQCSMLVF